jgi:polar amino acid transport system substrate-binding protein
MPKMHIVERIPSGDQYGLMMGKDHPMLGAVNDAISAMKQDGTLLEIYHKGFGADAEPGPSTIEVLEIPTAG